MTFQDAVHWLDDRLSQPVRVSLTDLNGGNSGAFFSGALAPGHYEVATIDSRGGQTRQWTVGLQSGFHLLEGDFVNAELLEGTLLIETRELAIFVASLA